MESIDCQTVGREFVRQYYTMLNQAPKFQYRFYSSVSSYVHGGIEKPGEEIPPVIGQAEINKKILSLNFNDCRTKIRQVDSQKTLGDGILIQVVGEISNDGEPMRRFMQSFVLGYQSAKNFYVHNDVFRYQDEMFYDDIETEQMVQVSSGNEKAENVENLQAPIKSEEELSGADVNVLPERPDVLVPGDPQNADTVERDGTTCRVSAAQSASAVEESQADVVERRDSFSAVSEVPDATAATEPTNGTSAPPSSSSVTADVIKPPNPASSPSSSPGASVVEQNRRNEELIKNASESIRQPLSWAAMAASSGPVKNQRAFTKPTPSKADQAPPAGSRGPDGNRPSTPKPLPQRPPVNNHRSSVDRGEREGSIAGSEGSERMQSHYPDDQQVFVGNLPHRLTEADLKKFLEEFGPVVGLRIHRSSTSNNVPNFGFVIFESKETVQLILASKPLICDNHRINVEEKMRAERPGSGGRGGRGGGGGGIYRGRGGNRPRAPRN